MRQILFRGKDKQGNWHYGSLHVDCIKEADKYYINSAIDIENPKFVEVTKLSVGQITDSVDTDGNDIYEGDLVNQKAVLIGDNKNVNFTGYVRFIEGHWVIDNGKNSIPLWSEHRENKIIE